MYADRDDFRVKKTIGSSWNVDEDDVVKTKAALKKTGDYKAPGRDVEVVDRNGRAIEFPKFSEFDEVERRAIEDDGSRQGEAVLVSIKETPDGEKFLIIDDLMKIEREPT